MKKATIMHPQNHLVPQNRSDIATEERLYDTIGDTNMLRYVQQMLKRTSSGNGESNNVDSNENTLSLNEGHHETVQQFPKQQENKLSPPKIKAPVTIATVHTIGSSLADNKRSTISQS